MNYVFFKPKKLIDNKKLAQGKMIRFYLDKDDNGVGVADLANFKIIDFDDNIVKAQLVSELKAAVFPNPKDFHLNQTIRIYSDDDGYFTIPTTYIAVI